MKYGALLSYKDNQVKHRASDQLNNYNIWVGGNTFEGYKKNQ